MTSVNESIAFNCIKLKLKELIHSCYSRNGVLNFRMADKSLSFKMFHMERLVDLFSDFDFEAGEMYLDVSKDPDFSVHSTY